MYELEMAYGQHPESLFSRFWQRWDTVMPIAELESIVGDSTLSIGVEERVLDCIRRVRSENIPEDDGYNAFLFGRNDGISTSQYISTNLHSQVVHIGAIYQFFQRWKDDIKVHFKYYVGNETWINNTIPIFRCTTCGRYHFYDALVFIDSNHCTCPDCEVNANKCSICGSIYHGDYCLNCFITTPCYVCGVVDSVGYNKRKGEWGACDKHKHLEPVPEKSYHWKPTMWKYRHMGKN